MEKKNYVNLDNARKKEQKEAMKRITERDECPFCWENLKKEHKKEILKEGNLWLVTENQWKYDQAEAHFLIIAKEHFNSMEGMRPEEWAELLLVLQWIEKEFRINSGGMGIRIGDIRYNGGTVSHFHIHFFKPYKPEDKEDYEPVRFRIGAREKPRDV